MKKIVVTLVNGTFAEDAPWIQSDSRIARCLKERWGDYVQVEKFSWDGHNTIKARISAAGRFIKHVKCVSKRAENKGDKIRHFAIAHSHGGNVVMLACKDDTTEKALAGVITLATPFLYFRKSRAAALLSGLGGGAFFLFLAALTGLGLMKLVGIKEIPWESTAFDFFYVISMFAMISFTTLLTIKNTPDDLQALSLRNIDFEKVLVLRSVGDEAGGLLAGSAVASWISVFLFSKLNQWIKLLFSTTLGCLFILALVVISMFAVFIGIIKRVISWQPIEVIFDMLSTGFYVFMAPIVVFLIIPSLMLFALRFLCLFIYGWDAPFGYAGYMITAETTPTTGDYQVHMARALSESHREVPVENSFQAIQALKTMAGETMKHSEVYEDPEIIDRIITWIEKSSEMPLMPARGADGNA